MTGRHALPLETHVALALEDRLSDEDRVEAQFRIKDVLTQANVMGGSDYLFSAINGIRVRAEEERERLRATEGIN